MRNFILLVIIAFAAGCVSVTLPKTSGEKAKAVGLTEPSKPFSEITSEEADRAWLSSENGNTISYLSDCNNPADFSLKQIENETLSVMNDLKMISTRTMTYNGREALESVASGTVDGIPVRMKIVSFKKNKCSFSLIYGGVDSKFESELRYFQDFLKDFKAP